MSITGELRDWSKDRIFMANGWQEINDIADRIDAEHERAVMSAMNDALYHANDESMAELGWVRMHKDADGEYIHEHDKVDWRDHAGTWHENATVVAVCSDGCYVMYALDGMVIHVNKSDIRHHHVPTVEDVLREFALAVCKDDALTIRRGVVEEYAAKLRLAESEDA